MKKMGSHDDMHHDDCRDAGDHMQGLKKNLKKYDIISKSPRDEHGRSHCAARKSKGKQSKHSKGS